MNRDYYTMLELQHPNKEIPDYLTEAEHVAISDLMFWGETPIARETCENMMEKFKDNGTTFEDFVKYLRGSGETAK